MAPSAGDEALMCNKSEADQNSNTGARPQLSQVKETFNTEQPTASCDSFRFVCLPAELRLKVYRVAIRSDSINILRTNYFVYQGASPPIYKAGIFRVLPQNYGLLYDFWCSQRTPKDGAR